MKIKIISALGIVGGAVSQILGGWESSMVTLLIFMGADYLTGLLVAGIFHASKKTENGALESRAGLKGLIRKGAMLLMVLIAYRLDLLAGTTMIKDAVCIALCVNEGLSILENVGLMGVKYPPVLVKALEMLQKEANTDDLRN